MSNIIDTHTHIFPERIARTAAHATAEFYLEPGTPLTPTLEEMMSESGTTDDLLTCAKEAGVDRCVVFSTATTPEQVEHINDFISAECRKHPEFIGVGTMHIDYPDFEKECDRMLDLGLIGIKLHPDIQKFRVDDDRMLPLYEIMQAKGMFLISHTGDSRYDYSGPRRMKRLAELFPEMDFICAHFAGWGEWDLAREIMKKDNIYMDTSSTFGFGGTEMVKKALDVFDDTHIFFGSDYPMWNAKDELEKLRALHLSDERMEKILYQNFERFLQSR